MTGVYLLVSGDSPAGEGRTVVVRSMKDETLTLDIDHDRTLEVKGPLGTTLIRIEDGAVQFIRSPCPHGLCISRGSISKPGQWIACLPNGVVARISGEADYDGITP